MATTVAHGLIGISAYCGIILTLPAGKSLPLGLKALVLAALAANIPDLDMLVSLLLLSDHKLLHGGITHSFGFAAILAVMVWLVPGWWERSPVLAITSFLLITSHVVVDWLTGPQLGLYPSHGLAPFWPASDSPVQIPLTLFKGVIHGDLLPGALYTAFWELIILGPVTGIIFFTAIIINKNKTLL